jgi:hypothetical protein
MAVAILLSGCDAEDAADAGAHICTRCCAAVSCRMFPKNPLPAERLATFTNAWIKGVDGVQYTPKGLAYSGVHTNSVGSLELLTYTATWPSQALTQRTVGARMYMSKNCTGRVPVFRCGCWFCLVC